MPPSAAALAAELDETLDFIAELDAVNIKEACEGFGTDDDALTDILCNRSKEQCARINTLYKSKFQQMLVDQVKDECGGDYKNFLVCMLTPPVENDADWLFWAMDGMGTTERVLNEIIMLRSNTELEAIKVRYQEKFDMSLVDHINDECGGDIKKLLVECLKATRDENSPPDEDLAEEQFEKLKKAAKGWGCDEDAFIEVLSDASLQQIELIKAKYEDSEGKSLVSLCEDELSGEFKEAICLRLLSPTDARCRLLKYSMEGMGTNEDTIARILGGSCKEAVLGLQARYDEKYSADLRGELESECGGDLGKAVLKWLAEPELGYFSDGELQAADALKGSTETPAEVSDEAISGFLYKKQGIHAKWNKMAASMELPEPAALELGSGSIEMADCTEVRASICPTARPFEFELCTSERTFRLAAGDADSYNAWMVALMVAVHDDGELQEPVAPEGLVEGLTQAVAKAYEVIATLDANNIKEACEGFGTNDDALTDILCSRTKVQRARINEAYKVKYGQLLVDQIKDECGGDYKTFLVTMLSDPADAKADTLFGAMDGLGTTEYLLSEVIALSSNAELEAVKTRYEEKYERALIDHINDEVDGDFRDFLVECLKCERDEEGGTDEDLAAEQAARLQEAAAGWGTDEAAFIEILGASSVEQMDLIEAAFEDLAGQSLKNTIEGEMGGDLEYAMLLRLETPVAAQCRILKKAFDGTGTDEDAIARVLGGATKADALVIKATYDEKYSADLIGTLRDECGGDLKKAVLKWLTPSAFDEALVEEPAAPVDEVPEDVVEAAPLKMHLTKPNKASAPPVPEGMVAYNVTTPEGIGELTEIAIRGTSGQLYMITTPDGAFAGSQFIALLPADTEPAPPPPPPPCTPPEPPPPPPTVEKITKCVGPIWGGFEAKLKAELYKAIQLDDSWTWTGAWWSQNGTSFCQYRRDLD